MIRISEYQKRIPVRISHLKFRKLRICFLFESIRHRNRHRREIKFANSTFLDGDYFAGEIAHHIVRWFLSKETIGDRASISWKCPSFEPFIHITDAVENWTWRDLWIIYSHHEVLLLLLLSALAILLLCCFSLSRTWIGVRRKVATSFTRLCGHNSYKWITVNAVHLRETPLYFLNRIVHIL